MCAGKNLLVQRFRLFELPLFQITGSLQENTVLSAFTEKQGWIFHLQKSHCPSAIPGCSSSWPRWDRQAPASSGRSPGPFGSNTQPPRTCPGSGTVRPSYLAVWQHQDGLFPEPGVRNSTSETPPSIRYVPPAKGASKTGPAMFPMQTGHPTELHASPQRSGWSH